MPNLDKNGLMAGSAERCENITENRSAGAAWLSNAAWRCVCESRSKQTSKRWVHLGPTGEQKPQAYLAGLMNSRESGGCREQDNEREEAKELGVTNNELTRSSSPQRVDVDA